MSDKLADGLIELELLSDQLLGKLTLFQRLVETWNERLGLVSYHYPDELVVKHLLDSLAPWKTLQAMGFGSFADIGSGAGFPGIPLALAFPEVRATLIERMERRAGFLETALGELNRRDVAVVQRTFEEVKDGFDLITFRAVSALDSDFVKKLKRRLNIGGHIAAYKGRREVIDAELSSLGTLAEGVRVIPVHVPFLDEERHLVVFPL